MPHQTRALLIAALIAATTLIGTSAAHASRALRFDLTTFSASGTLTFNSSVVSCPFLLTFTVSTNPFPKTTTQFGTVGGTVRACTAFGGFSTLLGPIRVLYRSFAGTLPFPTRINVKLADFGWDVSSTPFGPCLWGGVWDGIGIDLVGNRVSGIDFNSSTPLAFVRGGNCPISWQARGQLTTLLTTAPAVTLM